MTVRFSKMHGLGNDFMLINTMHQLPLQLDKRRIRAWADRRSGIGFDQLLVLADGGGGHADFLLRVYNADGDEVEQCGNGARCAALFIWQKRLSSKSKLRLALGSSVVALTAGPGKQVCADMGVPDFTPLAELLDHPDYSIEHAAYRCPIGSDVLRIGIVSMGNPHAVIVVSDLADYTVNEVGGRVQSLSCFSAGVNVGFMQIHDRRTIDLRVCERGVGETRACASGACAALAVGHRWGLLDDQVAVRMPGGVLSVDWPGGSGIRQCGAAQMVYDGTTA